MGPSIGIISLQSIFLTHWYNIKKTWKDNISKIALNNNKKYLMIKELEWTNIPSHEVDNYLWPMAHLSRCSRLHWASCPPCSYTGTTPRPTVWCDRHLCTGISWTSAGSPHNHQIYFLKQTIQHWWYIVCICDKKKIYALVSYFSFHFKAICINLPSHKNKYLLIHTIKDCVDLCISICYKFVIIKRAIKLALYTWLYWICSLKVVQSCT